MSSPKHLVRAALGVAALLASAPAWADPCNVPADCATGFCVEGVCCDSACPIGACQACTAALKGGGDDGVCGLAAAGTVCIPSGCGGADLAFTSAATCDAAGTCSTPSSVSCLHDNPCKFDLCDPSMGCQQVTKADGTACAAGMVCTDGVCGQGTSSASASSASASSGAGTGGASGTGGAAGSGGASVSSSGSPYPAPQAASGCGCRAAGDEPMGGAAAAVLGVLLLARRRQNRTSGAPAG